MEEQRFANNPRNRHQLGFLSSGRGQGNFTMRAAAAKPMSNDTVPPPPSSKLGSSSILERFRELLSEREEFLRVSAYEGPAAFPLPSDEVVRMYELVLSELTINSKPIITDLTIIAGDQREHGEGIAEAICARILEVPVEQKLPALYLLDSIVKNIGKEYVGYFSSHLPEVFIEAYRQVDDPRMDRSLRHLFGTWSSVFPSSVLQIIEAELQLSQAVKQQPSNVRGSESPRPTQGIHVNPKYLASVKSGVDNVRRASNLNIFGRGPSVEYDDYDSDQGDTAASQFGAQGLNSGVYDGRSLLGADKLRPPPGGPARLRGVEDDIGDWRKARGFDDKCSGLENVNSYNLGNGHKHDRTRALIDAYGQDSRQRNLNNNPPKIRLSKMDGYNNSKMVSRSWQNTEEEEFDWQDMNPSALDRRSNDFFLSSGGFQARPSVAQGVTSFTSSLKRSNWRGETQASIGDESLIIPEDTVPMVDATHGSLSKHLLRNDAIQQPDTVNSSGNWNLVGRTGPTTYPGSGVSSSAVADLQPYVDHLSETDGHVGRFSSVDVRSGHLGYDSLSRGPLSFQPSSSGSRPSLILPNSQAPPFYPTRPQQNQIRPHNDFVNMNNRVPNQGLQQFNGGGNKNTAPMKQPILPVSHPGLITSHHPTQLSAPMQHQFPSPQESQLMASRPLSHGNIAPSYGAGTSNTLMAPFRGMSSLLPQQMSSTSLQAQGVVPSLPRGPTQFPPFPHGTGPIPNQPSIVYSGLINSLVSQGIISLTNQAPAQNSLGVEFDQDLIKVRHESAVKALYADLPRQCTTCGLRFKTQEEHSKHMDWHVTKNRMSRNRKQKPSRKWFVSTSMWLSGAEALGTESTPGFLPAEAVEEKAEEEELAVPADEDQKTCALCGESFEDFYSDETDEWMYRGAVYLNVPDRASITGMDRSQLGAIVHAKCRSDSTPVLPKDIGQEEENHDGSQRKRMRF